MSQVPSTVVRVGINANSVPEWAFYAERDWELIAADYIPRVVGSDGSAVPLTLRKITADAVDPSAAAGATVIELLDAAFDLKGTADTVQRKTKGNGKIVQTGLASTLKAGDRIGIKLGGTMTAVVGTLLLYFKPVGAPYAYSG